MANSFAIGDLVAKLRLDTSSMAASLDAARAEIASMAEAGTAGATEMGARFDAMAAQVETAMAAISERVDAMATAGDAAFDQMAGVADKAFANMQAAADETAVSAEAAFSKVAAASETSMGAVAASAGKGTGAIGAGFALAGAVGAYEVLKMGSNFQASMEMLATNAGVGQNQIKGLSNSVLQLAGQVGTDPNSLAQGLYHVESSFASTGITGQKAMELLKTAAEGARLGNADLVDVTNALDGAVVANIPGVQNLDQAMGALNATVGSGDMHMQDLADAFGHGTLDIAKGFGLSIRDVGAALADFGDNNMRGAMAGTQLRMTLQSLAKATPDGEKELTRLGMTTNQLAKDMQTGGLNKAITDLKDHLDKAGITGDKVGAELTDMFGKRAGVGVQTLINDYDRFESKYKDIDAASGTFAEHWAKTQDTFKQKWAEVRATVDSVAISLGEKLLPAFSVMADAFTTAFGWLEKNKTAWRAVQDVIVAFAAVVGGALVIEGVVKLGGVISKVATAAVGDLGKLAKAFGLVTVAEDGMTIGPFGIIAAAVAALGLAVYEAYQHFKPFHDAVNAVGKALQGEFQSALREVSKLWFAFKDGFDTWDGSKLLGLHGLAGIFVDIGAAVGKVRRAWDAFMGGFQNPNAGIAGHIQGLTRYFLELGEDVRQIVDFISAHWKGLSETFAVAGAVIAAVLFPIPALLLGLAAAAIWAYNHFQLFRDIVKDVAGVLVSVLWTAVTTVGHVLGDLAMIVGDVIKLVTDVLTGHWGRAWNDVVAIVKHVWDAVLAILGGIGHIILALLEGAWSLLKDSVGRAMNWMWNEIKKAFDNVVHTFVEGGKQIGHVAGEVWHGVVSGVESAIGAVGRFAERLPGMIARGADAIARFAQSLPERIAFMLGALVGLIARGGIDLAKGLYNGITTGARDVWNFFTSLPSRIMGFLRAAGHWLMTTGMDLLRGLGNGIIAAATDVWNWFLDLPGKLWSLLKSAVTWLVNTGEDILKGMWNGIVSGAVAVWNWLLALPGEIWKLLKDAANWLVSTGMDLLRGLGDGIISGAEAVWNWFRSLPGTIAGFAVNAVHWLEQAGKDILNGLINGLEAAKDAVVNKLKDIANSAIKGFMSTFGIKSPSTVFHSFGQNIVQGLTNGIESSVGLIHRAMGSVTKAVGGASFGASLSVPGVGTVPVTATGGGNVYVAQFQTVPYTPQQVAGEAMQALLNLERVAG